MHSLLCDGCMMTPGPDITLASGAKNPGDWDNEGSLALKLLNKQVKVL